MQPPEFSEGDILLVIDDIFCDARDWGYGGMHLLANKGEKLVVLQTLSSTMATVRKQDKPNASERDMFIVTNKNVVVLRKADESEDNLVYSVIFPYEKSYHRGKYEDKMWQKVNGVLREFKKKKHSGFYFDIEELPMNAGCKIKVYKDTCA